MPLTGSLQTTPYNPAPGQDPIWESLVPTFDIRRSRAEAEARRRRDEAQTQYGQSIYDLGNQVQASRQNTLSSLEGRGVLSSGETQTRLSQIAAQQAESERRAALALGGAQSGADTGLSDELTQIGVDRERAVQEALARKQQADIDAWVRATQANQQADQLRLLQAIANKQPSVTYITQPGAARTPTAAPQPSQADLLRLYSALNPGAASSSSRYTPGRIGPQ